MTVDELTDILRYVAAACSLREPVTPQQTAVWFDLLGDLDAKTVKAAVRQVVIDHPYPNLPPVGAVRKAALELQQPSVPGPVAWRLTCEAVQRHGSGKKKLFRAGHDPIEIDNEANGLASLPPQVARAARSFGWKTLCDTSPADMGIAQTQFLKVYATLGESEQRHAIMPPSVKAIAAQVAGGFMDASPKALEGIR